MHCNMFYQFLFLIFCSLSLHLALIPPASSSSTGAAGPVVQVIIFNLTLVVDVSSITQQDQEALIPDLAIALQCDSSRLTLLAIDATPYTAIDWLLLPYKILNTPQMATMIQVQISDGYPPLATVLSNLVNALSNAETIFSSSRLLRAAVSHSLAYTYTCPDGRQLVDTTQCEASPADDRTGVVAGAVIGSIFLVLFLILAWYYFCIYRKRQNADFHNANNAPADQEEFGAEDEMVAMGQQGGGSSSQVTPRHSKLTHAHQPLEVSESSRGQPGRNAAPVLITVDMDEDEDGGHAHEHEYAFDEDQGAYDPQAVNRHVQ